MNNEFETFKKSRNELQNLLASLAEDEDRTESNSDLDRNKADILQQLLLKPIPRNIDDIRSLPTMLRQMCEQLPSMESQSIEQLLFDKNTSIPMLKWIKEFGKQLTTKVPEEQIEAAGIIYHAAIASALVYHHEKITSFSYENLVSDFTELIGKTWTLLDIRQLFSKAKDICIQNITEQNAV